jgi:hypothetical protein
MVNVKNIWIEYASTKWCNIFIVTINAVQWKLIIAPEIEADMIAEYRRQGHSIAPWVYRTRRNKNFGWQLFKF